MKKHQKTSKFIKNHQNPSLLGSNVLIFPPKPHVSIFWKRPPKSDRRQLPTIISPSSGGVGKKTRYLWLSTHAALSRKPSFKLFCSVKKQNYSMCQKISSFRKIPGATLWTASIVMPTRLLMSSFKCSTTRRFIQSCGPSTDQCTTGLVEGVVSLHKERLGECSENYGI